MIYKYLKQELNNNILILTFDKPESLNALNIEFLDEINKVFEEIENDEKIRIVIVTGSGKAFIAGADISQMEKLSTEESLIFAKRGSDIFSKIENLNKPVIAAINGFALGGGCELALSCDIRIASKNAKFGFPEVTLGIMPGFGGTQRLPREIGISKAKELIFTGEILSSEKALNYGLISKIVEPEELLKSAIEIAEKISNNSKAGVSHAKFAINKGLQTDINTGIDIERINFALCFSTEDQKDGMKAFLEKRKPNFNKE